MLHSTEYSVHHRPWMRREAWQFYTSGIIKDKGPLFVALPKLAFMIPEEAYFVLCDVPPPPLLSTPDE